MAKIKVVTGPPAAGKSSHVRDNKGSGDIVVDFDQLAQALGSDTSHDAGPAIKAVTFAAREAAIELVLAGVGADAWIIHTSPSTEHLEAYAAAEAETVLVDPGIDVVLAQAAADGRPDWTEQSIRDWYDRQPEPGPAGKSAQPSILKGGQAMDPILISKTFVAKAEATATAGEFIALVSAFGNEDSQGDVVEKGAFAKTLAEWIIKGRPIPVVWAHQFQDPEMFLGKYTAAEETDAGLKLTGMFDLDHPKAARVHKLMQEGLIVEFSISGMVREYELIEKDDDESWWPSMVIKDIDLWEAGPCFKGANDQTELISVKTDGRLTGSLGRISKAGRVLAQKHVDSLIEAHAKIGEIIAAAETAPPADDAAKTGTCPSKCAATHPGREHGEPAPDSEAPATKSALTPAVRALLELSQ